MYVLLLCVIIIILRHFRRLFYTDLEQPYIVSRGGSDFLSIVVRFPCAFLRTCSTLYLKVSAVSISYNVFVLFGIKNQAQFSTRL